MKDSLKLSEFLELIKSTLDMGFGYQGFWVVAELSEWRKSGAHYYGELIEHDGQSKYPVAKIRCNCWANLARTLLAKFKDVSGEQLKADMKVLFKVSVNYHLNFGLSLNIVDVDPAFTLGAREAKKKEILDTLTKEGIVNNNKNLSLPLDYTKIAVISSLTAAGKGDFFEEANKLEALGLCNFDVYEAIMQGKDCANSVSKAFEKVLVKADQYDAIVLIRGGGSQADLDWFNNILSAQIICESSVPVFVGIGHERDRCVLDDICTRSFDTPSKVINYIANTIIDNALQAKSDYEDIVDVVKNNVRLNIISVESVYSSFIKHLSSYLSYVDNKLTNQYENINITSKSMISIYEQLIDSSYQRINDNSNNNIRYYNQCIDSYHKEIISQSNSKLSFYNQGSEYFYKQILSSSIEPTLKRGFSVTTTINNSYITTQQQARKQSLLIIKYSDGDVQVRVDNGDTK